MQPTRLFALGGMQEIGKTTIVVEHENEIVIIDAGIKFANSSETGIEGIIPDYTYLKENEKKIKGLFITHGHEDHIGGIPYLITQVKFDKIFAPAVAIDLIKTRLQNMKIQVPIEFVEIKTEEVFKFDNIKVDFWTSQHSIPDSFGIRVTTPNGSIFDTGDFRFDYTPIGNMTDFSQLEKFGKEGVSIFISDSTNSMSTDHSPTEQIIIKDIEDCIVKTEGKVIFTTFASNINRIKVAIDLAVKHNRKVCAFGKSMLNAIKVAQKYKFIDVPDKTFIDKKEVAKTPSKNILILSTGSQGEELAALSKMSSDSHPHVKLSHKDVVIFSSSAIPGNRMKIELLINQLYKIGAEAKENKVDGILHTSGHAYKDEHTKIFEILKPKYFVPYHGAYRQSAVHGHTAHMAGVKENNIFVIENGQVIELLNGVAKVSNEKIDTGPIYIDSYAATRETGHVIQMREKLAENGFVNVIAVIDKKRNDIVGKTKIISRGAIYVKSSIDEMENIQRLAHGSILFVIKNNPNWTKDDIKSLVSARVEQYFYKSKRRNPVVLVSIMEKGEQSFDKQKNFKKKEKPKVEENEEDGED